MNDSRLFELLVAAEVRKVCIDLRRADSVDVEDKRTFVTEHPLITYVPEAMKRLGDFWEAVKAHP